MLENCKIVHDGSHFVAALPQVRPYGYSRPREKSEPQKAFISLYKGSLSKGVYDPAEQRALIKEVLSDTFGTSDWDRFIDAEFEREQRNLFSRKKRFFRKAFLNEWNYFVTFTYDASLLDEETFKQKLRRCLSNLHTRRNWRYMGVYERSPDKERLHFHGIFYIPEGEMPGELAEVKDYSTKKHAMQVRFENSFFRRRFGINDFKPLVRQEVRDAIVYVVKYLSKTGDRIVYSRGVPSELRRDLSFDQCACEFFDFIKKWVLYDDWDTMDLVVSDDILEGDEACEWLLSFCGYDQRMTS